MAKEIGYWENNVVFPDDPRYSKGPFVLVDACGWRVEVGVRGIDHPILPDAEIYRLLEKRGYTWIKTCRKSEMETSVDFLNLMCKEKGELFGYSFK